MALFPRKKPLQRLLDGDFGSDDERATLLAELRRSRPSPASVIPLITYTDHTLRKAGVELFAAAPQAQDVRALLLHLSERSANARTFGTRFAAQLAPRVVAPAIDELLEHRAGSVRRVAWEVGTQLPGEAGARFVRRALREGPPPIQLAAVQRLAQTPDADRDQVIELLTEACSSDDAQVVGAAVEQLEDLDDPRVGEVLIDVLATGDAASRARATAYLRRAARRDPVEMRTRMLRLMAEGEDATRRLAVEILLSTGDPAEVVLAILEFSKNLAGWLRTRILETLQTFGDDVLRPALLLLQHPDESVKTSALVLAEQMDDPRIVEPVCRMLRDDDWWLRIAACDTLGRLGDPRAVPHLVEALDDPESRWAAIDALASLGDARALEPLSRLLTDDRTEVRIEVVRAIERFSDDRGLHLLDQVRQYDPVTAVRNQADAARRALAERLEMPAGFDEYDRESLAVRSTQLAEPIEQLLTHAREEGASDLHLTVGEPPMIRRAGRLARLEGWEPLDREEVAKQVTGSLSKRHRRLLDGSGEVDYCVHVPDVGRYRGNAYVQRKGLCAAFRVIPNVPPSFADLRLPGHLAELLDYHQGLIVVAGSSSSGKSTTLTAIVNLINESKAVHVITLEDPVEFVHPVKSALINQREVGTHTRSFGDAVRAALREDPDVIMVGEMRDLETIRMALMAAETGHLVIGTLHTTSAVQSVERLIQAFPPDEQPQIRTTLSETLKFVICQALLPRADGDGRVARFEILKNTFSVAAMIRDGKTYQIPNLMQLGQRIGMRTVDMALMELVEAQLVAPEVAWAKAESPAEFEGLCSAEFLDSVRSELEQAEEDER